MFPFPELPRLVVLRIFRQALLDGSATALGVGAASLCSSLSHLMSEACVTSSVRCPVIKIMHAYVKYVGSRGCRMHRHKQREAGTRGGRASVSARGRQTVSEAGRCLLTDRLPSAVVCMHSRVPLKWLASPLPPPSLSVNSMNLSSRKSYKVCDIFKNNYNNMN